MSRIGKKPINIPKGVMVKVHGNLFTVDGPEGSLSQSLPMGIGVKIQDDEIMLFLEDDNRRTSQFYGLTRTLLSNMVTGVAEGFKKQLEISGVGYRADVQGDTLNLALGYSHPVRYKLPEGITATVERQTLITIKGADKQKVGQAAADIRAFRKIEPYKGKGIRYSGERIKRKAGKAGKGGR